MRTTHSTPNGTHSKKSTLRIRARALVARDIMTEDPMVIDVDANIGDAFDILASLEIRHLPVMRGGVLVGMLSDRDLQPFAAEPSRSVASVMNTNVISVEPDASIAEVAATLVDNRIGAVPVVDGREGELLGIVSYIDVLRDLAGD